MLCPREETCSSHLKLSGRTPPARSYAQAWEACAGVSLANQRPPRGPPPPEGPPPLWLPDRGQRTFLVAREARTTLRAPQETARRSFKGHQPAFQVPQTHGQHLALQHYLD